MPRLRTDAEKALTGQAVQALCGGCSDIRGVLRHSAMAYHHDLTESICLRAL